MAVVEIVGLTVLIILLLGLAGGFMAKTLTSTNLAWMQGVGMALSRRRGRTPRWFGTLLRGEEPRPPDDE